jgi:hypothetical protein
MYKTTSFEEKAKVARAINDIVNDKAMTAKIINSLFANGVVDFRASAPKFGSEKKPDLIKKLLRENSEIKWVG